MKILYVLHNRVGKICRAIHVVKLRDVAEIVPASYINLALVYKENSSLRLLHHHTAQIVFALGGVGDKAVVADTVAGEEADVGVEGFQRVDRRLTDEGCGFVDCPTARGIEEYIGFHKLEERVNAAGYNDRIVYRAYKFYGVQSG